MINIVFCLNKKILNSLKSIITSILHNTKRKVHFYIICPESEKKEFNNFIKLNNMVNIKLGHYNPSEKVINILSNCKFKKNSKISNYARFFIKTIFPNLEKIIYLDTDILVLDDIGKLWDSVEFNENNFFASPKYIFFHKLFYIKKLSYYYKYLNENNNFFNGGVFMTDLKFWDQKLHEKLYHITADILDNDISHLFTETLLNILFPNFIELDPSWNCSGYGQNKFYYFLRLRDYNLKPKIIHWSGHLKPWDVSNVYKKDIWDFYFKTKLNYIYLLYYDNNPSNGISKFFIDSVNKLNYNLVLHNVAQYDNIIDCDKSIGINLRRHYCIKYFIEKKGIENIYLFTDAYDIFFTNFDYRIIEYILENKIKILYQNSTLGFRGNSFISECANNMCWNNLGNSSLGVNGGSFIGKGFNILNFYSELFKYIRKNDKSDECLICRVPNLHKFITLDTKYFSVNTENLRTSLNLFWKQKLSDVKIIKDINPNLFLIHFCSSSGRKLLKKFKDIDYNLDKLEYSNYRYYLIKIYFIVLPFILTLIKIIFIFINFIYNLFKKNEKNKIN